MDPTVLAQTGLEQTARQIAIEAAVLADRAAVLAHQATQAALVGGPMEAHGSGDFLALFTVFVLAIFVGFYVVWSVTPALHSPLMAVTNAISSVIIVGGLLAAGPAHVDFSSIMGFFAVLLASVNIFGGFIVTQRMLGMFKKKVKK
ncbi:MAG: NAD(P) transhydrogenase subunit alpha [Rhodospirillales bacterium]|nr:NAD(P) transhydrogenase subunit alpha [Rhodospirillales bacterium]